MRSYKDVAYWVTTVLGPASFVIGGVLNLAHAEQPIATTGHLGFPVYFATIVGFWKLAGAIVTVLPRLPLLKEWAYAGFFFTLTGAAASHAFSGDGVAQVAPPLVFLALVVASWALRPTDRRLPGTNLRFSRASDPTLATA